MQIKMAMFGPTVNLSSSASFHLTNVGIEWVCRHQRLDVVLNKGFSFENHVDLVSDKAWGSLRVICATNMYLSCHIRCPLAHTLLIPEILHCREIVSVFIEVMLACAVNIFIRRIYSIINMITRFMYNVGR